jgi:acyl-coenzyme A synthetase/AMP-(fatty) acid ligase
VIVVGGQDDTYEPFLAGARPAHRSPEVTGEDLWLVMMYSSGTTGRPKGVMLSHRNIVAHTQNAVPVAPMGPGDRNLVAMPLFHVGGTCYALFGIRPRSWRRSPPGPPTRSWCPRWYLRCSPRATRRSPRAAG